MELTARFTTQLTVFISAEEEKLATGETQPSLKSVKRSQLESRLTSIDAYFVFFSLLLVFFPYLNTSNSCHKQST